MVGVTKTHHANTVLFRTRNGHVSSRFADGLSKARLAIETQQRPCIDLAKRLLIDLKPAF